MALPEPEPPPRGTYLPSRSTVTSDPLLTDAVKTPVDVLNDKPSKNLSVVDTDWKVILPLPSVCKTCPLVPSEVGSV